MYTNVHGLFSFFVLVLKLEVHSWRETNTNAMEALREKPFRIANRYFIQGNNTSQFFIYLFIWIVWFNRRSTGSSSNRND